MVGLAADVVGNAATIEALGLHAQVSDSVAGVNAETAELQALGATLQSITLTDTNPVLAAAAAALVPLVAKLTGTAITVSDTASAVDTALAALETLGTHVSSVTVADSAADVALVASDLAGLGSELHIALSDTTPVTVLAGTAAGLLPVVTQLGSATIDVLDTLAQIATGAATLAELGNTLGTVTVSGSTTTDAATAAELLPIVNHLASGTMLNVTDTANGIAGATGSLGTLISDGLISSITAANDSASDVVANATTLAIVGATATIHDSAAQITANLDALEPLSGNGGVLTGITLNGVGTADIGVSLGQLTTDATVLALISSPFQYAITDSSANIASDLAKVDPSQIVTLGTNVDTITLNGTDYTLTLSATTAFAAGVDDSSSSAVAKITNLAGLAVTGMSIQDFASLDLLFVPATSFAVADNSGNIHDDLNDNTGSSVLLAHINAITTIMTSGTITLDYATATTAGVNDGAGSVFSKMSGETLDVTGVPAAAVLSVLTTNVAAASITVADSAGGIAASLETASPTLVQ